MIKNNIIIRNLGLTSYKSVFDKMHTFTQNRTACTIDEIWFTEHFPVFTQGKTGKKEHILLQTETIPVIHTDRGGQVTYHGPGQQIMYILIDLKRKKQGIKDIVHKLEQCVIDCLSALNITAQRQSNAPGVYIENEKICSLGLRILHGCTLHGLALNINMDLSPFLHINPCGYAGLKMTQLSQWLSNVDNVVLQRHLATTFAQLLRYDHIDFKETE